MQDEFLLSVAFSLSSVNFYQLNAVKSQPVVISLQIVVSSSQS